MHNVDIEKCLEFLIEVDQLKSVMRASPLVNLSRRENSAEHSWHLAMYAIVFANQASVSIDIGKVVSMLLVHDIVEIDAGDTPLHESGGHDHQLGRELEASKRIFGMLPPRQGEHLRALWREFEAADSPEAKFAKCLDRLQPLIQNISSDGGTWKDNNVTRAQVFERYRPTIESGSSSLWEVAQRYVNEHFDHQTRYHGEQDGAEQPPAAVDLRSEGG